MVGGDEGVVVTLYIGNRVYEELGSPVLAASTPRHEWEWAEALLEYIAESAAKRERRIILLRAH